MDTQLLSAGSYMAYKSSAGQADRREHTPFHLLLQRGLPKVIISAVLTGAPQPQHQL